MDCPRRHTTKRGQKVSERKILEVPPHLQVLGNNVCVYVTKSTCRNSRMCRKMKVLNTLLNNLDISSKQAEVCYEFKL